MKNLLLGKYIFGRELKTRKIFILYSLTRASTRLIKQKGQLVAFSINPVKVLGVFSQVVKILNNLKEKSKNFQKQRISAISVHRNYKNF